VKRTIVCLFLFLLLDALTLPASQTDTIYFKGKMPEGLAGNGKSVVRVRNDGFIFHTGGNTRGNFSILQDGHPVKFENENSEAEFFPGGVEYKMKAANFKLEILHGSLPGAPYFICFRFTGDAKNLTVLLKENGKPAVNPVGIIPVSFHKRSAEILFYQEADKPSGSYEELKNLMMHRYDIGFKLTSGLKAIDRTIPFNRYLMDLGFDGRLHVCEIFRWRDVWSRDLGSGLVPGALAAGNFSQAKTTIEYDLKRYASHNPASLKVTDDPSQGGTAEGMAWLTSAVWQYYLYTGDKSFLSKAERILLPWVKMWISRDYKDEGILTDVSEWMDHSRYLELPDGSRILYSNALFVKLLDIFCKVELECGKPDEYNEIKKVGSRFVTGINEKLWNDKNGIYDNLSLWDLRDERSASAANMLAIDCGVAPKNKIPRILNSIVKNNWRKAGSTTIYPPMTVVDLTVDHNYKMWPWWNALEASVRFRNGDIDGGVHLLECCSKTLEDEHYPGLIEELTSPEGVTEGGNAFLTAAGSYLDAVKKGLLGFEILEPGCARIRVNPHVPKTWKNWSAEIPLCKGKVILSQIDGKLKIKITDKSVKVVETQTGVTVVGSKQITINENTSSTAFAQTTLSSIQYPEIEKREAVVFYDTTFNDMRLQNMPGKVITAEELAKLDTAKATAFIVMGNALPLKSKSGNNTRTTLDHFLSNGNAIVFYGATMQDRGVVGETGGVIDWYDFRPSLSHKILNKWLFKTACDSAEVPRAEETGFVNKWFLPSFTDNDWEPIRVPQLWEDHLKKNYDGWGWYRTHFNLPAEAKGKAVYINLGMIDDVDWTYINGSFLGSKEGWQEIRRYAIQPGDSLYSKLNFGGDNVIAVQILDTGGGGGLYKDTAMVEIESGNMAWQPVDVNTGMTLANPLRSGVLYAGNGNYFNSWETARGAFGFSIEGSGIEFQGPLSGLTSVDVPVREAFTDFAIAKPLLFQPMGFTKTNKHLLIPDNGERYPCIARIHNTVTGSDIFLIPASLTGHIKPASILPLLGIQ